MSVSRERLQEIFDDADEADGRWNGSKKSLLASWVRDLVMIVAELDEGQERLEGDIGALSDAVDEIVDGLEGDDVDPLYPEYNDHSDEPESGDTIDLTAVPYVLDLEIGDYCAFYEDGTLYVGVALHHALLAAQAVAE